MRGFADGLGQRVVTRPADGVTLEALRVCAPLAGSPGFTEALRDAVVRLGHFSHPAFNPPPTLERLAATDGRPVLVGPYVAGRRLIDLLRQSEISGRPFTTSTVLYVVRDVLEGVRALHRAAPGVWHGALGPERIMLTTDLNVIVLEHVLGGALAAVGESDPTVWWQRFGLAVPHLTGTPPFGPLTDQVQIGLVGLAMLLGRPLREDEYPGALPALLGEARETDLLGQPSPLGPVLRQWFARALLVSSQGPFPDLDVASADLAGLLSDEGGYLATPVGLDVQPEGLEALPVRAPRSPVPAPSPDAARQPRPSSARRSRDGIRVSTTAPASLAGASAGLSADTLFDPARLTPIVGPPTRSFVDPTLRADPAVPAASPWTRAAPAAAGGPGNDQPDGTAATPQRRRVASAAVPGGQESPRRVHGAPPVAPVSSPVSHATPAADHEAHAPLRLLPLGAGLGLGANLAAEGQAILGLAGRSAGVPGVFSLDGAAEDALQGPGSSGGDSSAGGDGSSAPATVPLGRRLGGLRRLVSMRLLVLAASAIVIATTAVAAGHRYFAPDMSLPVRLHLDSEPRGASVTLEGRVLGKTPLETEMAAGPRFLEIRGQFSSYTLAVHAEPGMLVREHVKLPESGPRGSLDINTQPAGVSIILDGVNLGPAPVIIDDVLPGVHRLVAANGANRVEHDFMLRPGADMRITLPVSGWIDVSSAIPVRVTVSDRPVPPAGRIAVAPGRHRVVFENDELRLRDVQDVVVEAGHATPVTVAGTTGSMRITSQVPAQVQIDGRPMGQTPLDSVTLPLGRHQVTLFNRRYGEVSYEVVVGTGSNTLHATFGQPARGR
jgi:hypothetical protein